MTPPTYRYRKALIAGISVATAVVALADAGPEKAADANVTIRKLSLFKNGLGYFNAEATLPEGAETVRIGQLPVPVFGTFWVDYAPSLKLRALVTSLEDVDEAVPVQNMGELLRANAGRDVILHVGCGPEDVIKGTVLPRAKTPEESGPPSPYLMSSRPAPGSPPGRTAEFESGNVVLIRTARGITAINPNSVARLEVEGEEVASTLPFKLQQPSLRVELDQPALGEQVSVSYLAKGITWAPGYRIDLSGADLAKVSARALVINEVADLDNVKVEFITGYPNIQFDAVLSPIAMSQNLSDFLNALMGGETQSRQGMRGAVAQQAVVMSNISTIYDTFSGMPAPGYSSAVEGRNSEDLFLYPVEHLSLKKGETAWIPLFSADLPYQHVYTWKIADFLDQDGRYRPNLQPRDENKAEEVWHCCRLVNNLKMPLTTAPAEFTKDGAFTGQDICYYTAPGAETTVRINRAMNVLAEQAELEVDRTLNAVTINDFPYDRVKVQGELRIRNRQNQAVNMEVTKELSGEVTSSSPEAKDVKTAKGLKQVNARHELTWQIEIKPGEERTLTYGYEVLVRR